MLLQSYIIINLYPLQLCSRHHSAEVKQLANAMLDEPSAIGHTSKHPFIVVEGLDGTGIYFTSFKSLMVSDTLEAA